MAESHREEIAKLEALYAGNPGGRVFVHLAEAYRKAGEHERARRILDEGLARHTDSASGYVVLGRVLADMQITAEAEIAFRRVLELDGGNLVALRWLGDLARQSGRNREAALHYRELLTRNPSNEEVRDLVEIVEREAESGAVEAATAPGDGVADAFAGLDEPARDQAALAEPLSDAEEHAVTAPAHVPAGQEPDMTSWSTAPGQTGDAEEPPVEYGLVELDTSAVSEVAETGQDRQDPDSAEPAGGAAEFTSMPQAWAEDESGFVASTDDDDTVELEELRRDDEAEPIEIHLLDPSYEPSEQEEEDQAYAGELDLSGLAAAGPLEDADDYADDTFVADLAPSAPPEEAEDYADDTFVADLAPSAPPEEAEDYADETFVADLAPSAPPEDADDYADETFVADLSAAGQEEPPPDELPGGVDVMQAGDALTLLPDEGDTETDTSEAPAAEQEEQEVPQDTAEVGPEAPEPAALSDPGLSALAGAAEPAAEATAPAEARRGADGGLVTETMAILYRSQGFHDRAAEVYRALLEARPGDERLAARLREAEEVAGAAARPKTEDDAGEVWLRGVGAAWTGPTDSATADATPYAWTAESEEAEAGEPIGSYLQDLVSWKAGSTAWRQSEPEPEAPEQADFEMPGWLDGPGGAEAWTPDEEPAGFPPAPAAESDWSPSEPVDHEPWATSPPAGEDVDAAAPDAEAAVPWEPEGQRVVPPRGESEAGAGEETDGGWTPMDLLDNDMPSVGVTPGDAGRQDAAPAQEDSSDDDDDDLEMFRSWLQSLKK